MTATPLSPEAMKTSQLVSYIQHNHIECETAYKTMVARAKELYPALLELEMRFHKQPGQRNDLDDVDFPNVGWHAFLEQIGVNPSTFRVWKSRSEKRMQSLIDACEEAVPADGVADIDPIPNPTRTRSAFNAEDERQRREEITQVLLTTQKQLAATAAPLPALPSAAYTREQANADATMRMVDDLLGKYVWLVSSHEDSILLRAFDKDTAEEIAIRHGIAPVTCTNVKVADSGVIMQVSSMAEESKPCRAAETVVDTALCETAIA